MGAVTAAVIGGAALVGGYMQYQGAQQTAAASQNAANAQAAEAGRQRQAILQQGRANQDAAMRLAGADSRELLALDQSLGQAQKNLEREERLFAAIDPAMMEASQQALKLLRGENAGITDAMNQQRMTQRQGLVNTIRQQYGPGGETSSIGARLLQQFDSETNMMTQQANQGALNQVFGIGTYDAGARSRAGIASLQQVGQGFGALQERKLNAQLNSGNAMLGALSGTAPMMIQAAGAPYVGDAQRGQAMASFGQNIMNTGVQAGMIYGFGGGKGK